MLNQPVTACSRLVVERIRELELQSLTIRDGARRVEPNSTSVPATCGSKSWDWVLETLEMI